MSETPAFVLDSSALIAYLRDEQGADHVRQVLSQRVAISAVNWAEVLSKLAEVGMDPHREARQLLEHGVLANALVVVSLDEGMARHIALLRPLTRSAGLSLGDRACLALARFLSVPALTTDRAWEALKLGVKIQGIR